MKIVKTACAIIIVLIIFIGGYLTGKLTTHETTREIAFGFASKENTEQINYSKVITDAKHQDIIDNVMMIFMHRKPLQSQKADLGHPDTYLQMKSPKQSTSLINSKLWFTDEGAVIGLLNGGGSEQTEYFSINQEDADYLKEQIDIADN